MATKMAACETNDCNNWGEKIKFTLMKHFQLFSFDEES